MWVHSAYLIRQTLVIEEFQCGSGYCYLRSSMLCSEKLLLDCGRRQRDLSWYEDFKAGSYFTCRSLPFGILNGYLCGSVII